MCHHNVTAVTLADHALVLIPSKALAFILWVTYWPYERHLPYLKASGLGHHGIQPILMQVFPDITV